MKILKKATARSVWGLASVLFFFSCSTSKDTAKTTANVFPDGTPISAWFQDTTKIDPASLGKWYSIADAGAVADDSTLNTTVIQNLIDSVSANGGGVVVIPAGIFRSGAIFFKPGTHLYVEKDGVLKGSDDIANYPIMPSRMEGQNLDYFPALVNAYNVPGFTITGEGTIDGNGKKYWEAFWQRRKENPKCTNLEVSRPRLVFIWGCDSVQLQDVKLHNSGFWTTHLYQCNYAKLLDLNIFAPKEPVPAPSSDALDLDVCSNVLVRGCYMSVNDDAIAMKGGKGPWADQDPNNGPNENILVENCTFGFCHSTFTCGSESIHTKNVLMRNCTVDGVSRIIFLKMRPDTPQNYEYITLENIKGTAKTGIYIRPWRQFFDLQGRETPPVSVSSNITFRNFELTCEKFTEVGLTEYDRLENVTLENMNVKAGSAVLDTTLIKGLVVKNVTVNGEPFLQ